MCKLYNYLVEKRMYGLFGPQFLFDHQNEQLLKHHNLLDFSTSIQKKEVLNYIKRK